MNCDELADILILKNISKQAVDELKGMCDNEFFYQALYCIVVYR